MKKLIPTLIDWFNRHALVILIVWMVVLSVLYSLLSLLRHIHFQSGGFDLGVFDQAVWQYSRFQWPFNTVKDRFILGDHLTLTLPLLAPLYWFKADVRVLLVFQATWITASALAIFLLTRLRKFSPIVSLCLSVIYSLFYGIQFAVFFDFHPVVIGVGLLAWVAYFLESGKKRWMLPAITLLLLTQENMGIALASLGCIYWFRRPFRRTGVLFIVLGFAYSLFAGKVISWLSPVGFQYWPQISLNPFRLAWQFFDVPEKQQVWLYSFSWYSFLPLFSPGALFAVVVDLSQYFITGPEFARMWSPFMHHRAILAIFVALGTLEALELIRRKKINLTVVAICLVVAVIGQQFIFHYPLNKLSKPAYWQEESWMADNRALFAAIPAGASLATQQNFIPHLTHRNQIYLVWPRQHDFDTKPCGQRSCWWLDFGGNPQYLVVDTRPNQWLTQTLETDEHWQSAIANMEKAGKITLMRSVGAAKLYSVVGKNTQ